MDGLEFWSFPVVHRPKLVLQSRSYGPLCCHLRRPLIKILFLLVPYGYIIIKIKRIPKEMTVWAPNSESL